MNEKRSFKHHFLKLKKRKKKPKMQRESKLNRLNRKLLVKLSLKLKKDEKRNVKENSVTENKNKMIKH